MTCGRRRKRMKTDLKLLARAHALYLASKNEALRRSYARLIDYVTDMIALSS